MPRRIEPLPAKGQTSINHRSETRTEAQLSLSFRSLRPSVRPHVVALLALDGMFEPGVVIKLRCPDARHHSQKTWRSTLHHMSREVLFFIRIRRRLLR